MNEKCLAGSQKAADEITQLTDEYNNQIAGGKWRYMMSANPRVQVDLGLPKNPVAQGETTMATNDDPAVAIVPGADFVEKNNQVIMVAAHASAIVPGHDAHWQKIDGLGYNGVAVTIFPATVPIHAMPEDIRTESPCLKFNIGFRTPGEWKFIVRALPTFSIETGKPQRFAISLDDNSPQVVSLPASLSEGNRVWQENVLRNAALTATTNTVPTSGLHTLKIWMVDPGIVIDSVAAENGDDQKLGYLWPEETASR